MCGEIFGVCQAPDQRLRAARPSQSLLLNSYALKVDLKVVCCLKLLLMLGCIFGDVVCDTTAQFCMCCRLLDVTNAKEYVGRTFAFRYLLVMVSSCSTQVLASA